MNKLIKVSKTKAFQIQTIEVKGEKFISIRQMYATTKDETFRPARQGLSIPYDDDGKAMVKALVRCFKEEQKFKKLDLDKDKSDDTGSKKKNSKTKK